MRKCSKEECHNGKKQYVAVLSPEEWIAEKDTFEMGIDIEPDMMDIYTTNADVNYDSVTGTFAIPDRYNMAGDYHKWYPYRLELSAVVHIQHRSQRESCNDRSLSWYIESR